MEEGNLLIIVPAIGAAIALIVYLIFRNRSDRKKYINPSETDPVEGTKMDRERDRDRI